MNTIVFDIGGTHMRMALVEGSSIGRAVDMPTPTDPLQAIELLTETARTLTPHIGTLVGGVPSIVEDGVMLSATNLPRWEGYAFARELGERLGATVHLRNDAELAALGEATYGVGQGMRTVGYLGLGTGIGTACVIERKIVPHTSNGSGRSAVLTLKNGAWLEDLIGGRALSERHGVPPEALPAVVWRELTPHLAEGIANALFVWSPDMLVLGGSLMNEENGFKLSEVQETLSAMGATEERRIHKAALGSASGLYGAMALAN